MRAISIGIPFIRRRSGVPIDAQAQAHFNRVIADGGVVPSGLTGVNAFFSAVKAIYGTTDINTAISAAYDPHYLGYKLGAGSGTTLGQAAQKMYAPKGIFGGIGTGNAYWEGVGVVGNNVTTPAIVSPTTQLDVVSYVYASAGHTGAATILSNDGPNRNFVFNCQAVSTGVLQLRAGTPFTNFNSTTGVGNFDNYTGWIRATYNQNGINGDVTFYTSTNSPNTPINSITWVQLGSVVSSASTGLQTGTHSIQLGSNNTTNIFTGRIGIAAFSTSIGGSPSVLFNANQYTGANTWTSTTGEVWTVNSTGAGLADVTQTTAASQPLLLAHTGENYWFSPLGVTDNCSTPNATANQIVGDIELIFNFSFYSLVNANFISKRSGGSNISYAVNTQFQGRPQFIFTQNGSTVITAISSVAITTATNWLKVTRTQSNGDVIFYTSTNGTTWTQLGTTQSTASGNMFNGTSAITLGNNAVGGGDGMGGKMTRATISNSIGGTPVVDFNPSSYNPATSQTQWTSATGEVWTINTGTATTGYKGQLTYKTTVLTDGIDDSMTSTMSADVISTINNNHGVNFVAKRYINSNNQNIVRFAGDYADNNSCQIWFEGGNLSVNKSLKGTALVNQRTTANYTLTQYFIYSESIVYGGTTTQRLNITNNSGTYFNNTTNKPTIVSGNMVLFSSSAIGILNGSFNTLIVTNNGTKFVEINDYMKQINNI